MDSVTASKSRLEFAKICVEIGVKDVIPKTIKVILANGQSTTVFVEVPWLPHSCLKCNKFCHSDKACLTSKDPAPANLQIWRKKETTVVQNNPSSLSSSQVPHSTDQAESVPISNEIIKTSSMTPYDSTAKVDILCSPPVPNEVCNSPLLSVPQNVTTVLDHIASNNSNLFPISNEDGESSPSLENITKKPRSASLGVALLIKDLKSKRNEYLDKSKCVTDKGLDFTLYQTTAQSITAKVLRNGIPFFISVIYGSNDGTQRKHLWNHLKDLDSSIGSFPWILRGDFNIFLHSFESSDHDILGSYTSNEMKDFQDTIHDLLLQDHPLFGPTFTWSNKQKDSYLVRKLDRVLVNSHWVSSFQNSFVEFLAPGPSDHCMTIGWLNKDSHANRPKPFKFFNFWTKNPNFLTEVQNSWQHPMKGNPMLSLFLKLKSLKTCLRNLNKDCYSNISNRVKQKKTELEQIQLSTLNRTSSIDSELIIQSELSSLEHAENMLLKQKAKIQWLKEGDKCSKYFHSVIAFKNKRETIRFLLNDQGSRLEDFDDMISEVIQFFKNQLGKADSNVKSSDHNVLKNMLHLNLSPEALAYLEKNITEEEIKDAIFSQGYDKTSSILPTFNSTIIALVPKITNPSKVKDYRPISCCSVVYKDLVKGYGRNSISPRCAIKIDLQKAFDSLDWGFLSSILKVIDLPPQFITWIEACYSGARYSISFNGSLIGYFKGERGLR
ncbi:uncharacterized protein LOC120122261 [Hibiscus syriacus]|uniref:uncharacterized protein LOC120122261 n=1 Tax=Hibiscus syriacus TaxID=106335 RepID=UPI001923E970|nr:uncharacterized protein LOC120122261 [Hibiscus syriacus]